MKKTLIYLLSIVLFVTSCSKKESGISHVPFKETADGLWGMISLKDGSVLFSEEFKNTPSAVIEDRFAVKNNDGFWEIYTAESKPRKIGEEYSCVTDFENGVAVVTEKDKPVSIINKEGKVLKLLERLNGEEVSFVEKFIGGYAVYTTSDGLKGVINKDGNVVIPAYYIEITNYGTHKRFIALHKRYKDVDENETIYDVLDASGKQVLTLSKEKFSVLGHFGDGLLAVACNKDGQSYWGIIDILKTGDYVIKPTDKIKNILSINGSFFSYQSSDGYGVMNTSGEVVIRAKYDEIVICGEGKNIVFVCRIDDDYQILDTKGNPIGEKYRAILLSGGKNHSSVVIPQNGLYCTIVDGNGKELKGLPDMVDIYCWSIPNTICVSEYLDVTDFVNKLNIQNDGIDGITFNSDVLDVMDYYDKHSEVKLLKPTKEELSMMNFLICERFSSPSFKMFFSFHNNICEQTYRTERIGSFWFSYDRQIPSGYKYSNQKIESFGIILDAKNGKYRSRLRQIYEELCAHINSMGDVQEPEQDLETLDGEVERTQILLRGEGKVFVILSKDAVVVQYRK